MKKHWMLWVVLAAVLVHAGLFLALANFKPLPDRKPVPQPIFGAKELRTTDPETGEKVIYREYTVSTKLTPLEASRTP